RHADVRNFNDINSPCKSAVSIALILFVVPVNVRRWLILAERFHWNMLRDVISTSSLKFILGELIFQQPAADECLFQSQHRRLNQLAHNHTGARSDGWTTVGNLGRVRLNYFNQIVIEAQGFSGYLRKDRVRTLTNLSAGGQKFYVTFGRRFRAYHRLQVNLARPGEPRAVHERSEADASLEVAQTVSLRTQADSLRYILSREPFTLCMIIAQLKSAIEQTFHVDFFSNDLIGRLRLPFTNELATAEFFRTQPDRMRNFIHVSL